MSQFLINWLFFSKLVFLIGKNLMFCLILYKNYTCYEQTDNNIQSLIVLNKLFSELFHWKGLGLCQCDHINQMITLSVITLSGLHCTFKLLLKQIIFILQSEHLLDLFNVQFRINHKIYFYLLMTPTYYSTWNIL